MTEGTLRVALLARAGAACDRIGEALREAGADVVLVADPLDADPAQVRQAAPQAIVVALEPAIEAALERYDALLFDPAYSVVFEEAELAAQRAGWDAARWLRHLSAKLHNHGNVLPPGTEPDQDWQLEPGRPAPPPVVDADAAGDALAAQARLHAGGVPHDGLEPARGAAPGDGIPGWESAGSAAPGADGLEVGELVDDAAAFAAFGDISAGPAGDGVGPDGATPVLRQASAPGPQIEDLSMFLDAGALAAASPFDPVAFEADGQGVAGSAGIDLAGLGFADLAFDDDAAAAVAGDADSGPSAPMDAPRDHREEVQASPFDPVAFETGGLSLVGEDAPSDGPAMDVSAGRLSLAAAPAGGGALPAFDFESRIAGLSLADPDSYGHGPLRGAVLVEAGIGGPDAVRQLLAAIPQGFPRPVLVRLQLDGGRYDRLVRQMARVTGMPVELATAGAPADPGIVYFLPPEIVPVRGKGGLLFAEDAAAAADVPAALPPGDSAVLLLSGARPALADILLEDAWSDLLVCGQSADGCYDPTAAQAVAARGGASGTPSELAALLLERWPAPTSSSSPAEEPQS